MNKRKVQVSVFYCDAKGDKYFLLLKTNERRGNFWQNITGGVDEGETFRDAALREPQLKNVNSLMLICPLNF